MLQIILLILKFIGIAIASILGILFLLLILILVVPIRYRIVAQYYNSPYGDIRVGWLLRLINLRIEIKGNSPEIKLRIFGFKVMDNTKEKKERKAPKQKKSRPKRKKKQHSDGEEETDNLNASNAAKSGADAGVERIEQKPEKSILEDNTRGSERQEEGSSDGTRHEIHGDNNYERRRSKDTWIHKIIRFFQGIPLRIKNFQNSFRNIRGKIGNVFQKIDRVKEFISDEQNKLGFAGAFNHLLRYIRHFAPVKMKTVIRFGAGDPCLTAQILGAVAVMLPYIHQTVEITPEFEEVIFEGDFFAKGRIRLLTLLIITLKILFDKDCRKLKVSLFKLKEELL